jgi:hypothetical protein
MGAEAQPSVALWEHQEISELRNSRRCRAPEQRPRLPLLTIKERQKSQQLKRKNPARKEWPIDVTGKVLSGTNPYGERIAK